MDKLDKLIKFFYEERENLNNKITEKAKSLTLKDILEKVTTISSPKEDESGNFEFYISHCHIYVSKNKIWLKGMGGLVDREFYGEEVKSLYNKLSDVALLESEGLPL